MKDLTIKQQVFLKELRDLLLKYNAEIGWNHDECRMEDNMYISMLGQKDIDIYSSIDYNELYYMLKGIEDKKEN